MWREILGDDALLYVSSINASSSSAQFIQQTLAAEKGVSIFVAALNVSNAQNNLMWHFKIFWNSFILSNLLSEKCFKESALQESIGSRRIE